MVLNRENPEKQLVKKSNYLFLLIFNFLIGSCQNDSYHYIIMNV